ncbi:MAG: hypothetical protein RL693_2521 [Verrucomicrobiota bacterium]|jgi:hypothetical protein
MPPIPSILIILVCTSLSVLDAADLPVKQNPVPPMASLVPEGKLVLAHYMTKMVPGGSGERDWASPELHDPKGSTAALGGLYLTLPLWSVLKPDLSLEEAVDFEIHCARQMGVDGFQFYYPFFKTEAPLRDYNRIVRAFVQTAAKKYPGFKIALCLSLGGEYPELKEAQRIEIWGAALKELLNETATSPAWLRTRSGSLLFYHWATDGFADGADHMATTPEQIEKVAGAFAKLATRSGQAIDWVFHVRKTENDPPYIEAILKNFPAVWGWVEVDDDPAFWDRLAKRCAETGVAYTQTVYPEYFTSKVYALGDKHYQLLPVTEALKLGTGGIERHYRQTDLARGQARMLQSAIDRNAQIINYATWNDWPEGQHLAPEANHNFGPSLLLRHFAAEWRGQPSPLKDKAILFFKKHPSTAQPPNPIAVKVKSRRNEPTAEDEVQLVTNLTSPARCEFNGRDAGQVSAGFQITSLPLPADGPMHVRLLNHETDKAIIDFTTPLGLTRSPLRVDRLTYSYSSNFTEEFRALFGNAKPVTP